MIKIAQDKNLHDLKLIYLKEMEIYANICIGKYHGREVDFDATTGNQYFAKKRMCSNVMTIVEFQNEVSGFQ